MNIMQLKQKVESNLASGLFMLDGISLSNENISNFLTGLPAALHFTKDNATVSAGTLVQVVQNKGTDWNVSGVTAGAIQEATFSLLLSLSETTVDAQVIASGSFNIPALNHLLPVSGAISDPSGDVLELAVGLDALPNFPQLAEAAGLKGISQDFDELEMNMPSVTAARFGFDIKAKSIRYLAVDGSMPFGDSALDVSCIFEPGLTITGSLPEDGDIQLADIFSTLEFNASNAPAGDISTLNFILTPAAKSYSFALGIDSGWNVKLGPANLSVQQVGIELNHADNVTTATIGGQIAVGATSLAISASRNDDGNWAFNAGLAEGATVKIRSVINTFLPNSLDLPQEVPDMGCRDVSLTFLPATGALTFTASSAESWNIPVGKGLSITGIELEINRVKTGTTSKVSGFIGGTLRIGAASITTAYNFPGDFVVSGEIPSFKLSQLIQDICGVDSALSVTTSVPPGFLDAELTNIFFEIAPQRREMTLSASSPFGQSEIQIKQLPSGKWGFAVGLVPPENWSLSSIDQSLKPLDSLRFSNTSMILASESGANFALETVKPPSTDISIIRGLNLFATLGMAGTGVDQLLGIQTLVVYAAIGSDPQNIKLEAQVKTEYQIATNVYFGNFIFRLQPAPANFLVALEGNLRVSMAGGELKFTGGLGVQARPALQANMYARMTGTWQDPLGLKGVAVSDAAVDLKVPPIPPTLGLVGSLKVGSFTGAIALNIDPANPVLVIGFNRLNLKDIFDTFCPPEVKRVIPSAISNTVFNVGFENVNIYIVPKATTIAGVAFAQGTFLKGTMSLWGLRVSASVKIEQTKGVLIQGEVDPINIGGIFKLTGAGSNPKASLYLDLRTGSKPVIKVSGAVELLGFKSSTDLAITDKEFSFITTAKLFDKFNARLEVRGGDMINGSGIYVKATMQNDLTSYLRENATKEIEKVAKSATASLDAAEAKVTAEQAKVNDLDKQITAMRATVQAERDQDARNITAAQKKIDDAQATVNSLQSQINSAKARISQLNRDIANKRTWYDRLAWYDKTWGWAELGAYTTAKGAEITALYTKIGTLETAKHTAFGVLEAAKAVLTQIKNAAKTFPIEMDPRVAGLITLRASAKAALDLATSALSALQSAVGAAANVATFITRAGLGGLIDINEAKFEGSLSATNGGRVSLAVKLVFMGDKRNPRSYSILLNFKDPLSSAKDLAKLLLPG
jgi:hypothetical protein